MKHTQLIHLIDDAIFHIEGDDTWTWLQGQITQDVFQLQEGQSAYTFFVYPNGRIRADGFVIRSNASARLVVPQKIADSLYQDLDRHIVMEDVQIKKLDNLGIVTIQTRDFFDLPKNHQIFQANRWSVHGIDIHILKEDRLDWISQFIKNNPDFMIADESTWEQARIFAARPRFGIDFGDWTLPQETGLHSLAVSFTKGCYVGQEPVIMLEHRGKPPKRLCTIAGNGASPTAPIDLYKDDQIIGALTSVVQSELNHWIGIALIKRAYAVEHQIIHCDGQEARLLDMIRINN